MGSDNGTIRSMPAKRSARESAPRRVNRTREEHRHQEREKEKALLSDNDDDHEESMSGESSVASRRSEESRYVYVPRRSSIHRGRHRTSSRDAGSGSPKYTNYVIMLMCLWVMYYAYTTVDTDDIAIMISGVESEESPIEDHEALDVTMNVEAAIANSDGEEEEDDADSEQTIFESTKGEKQNESGSSWWAGLLVGDGDSTSAGEDDKLESLPDNDGLSVEKTDMTVGTEDTAAQQNALENLMNSKIPPKTIPHEVGKASDTALDQVSNNSTSFIEGASIIGKLAPSEISALAMQDDGTSMMDGAEFTDSLGMVKEGGPSGLMQGGEKGNSDMTVGASSTGIIQDDASTGMLQNDGSISTLIQGMSQGDGGLLDTDGSVPKEVVSGDYDSLLKQFSSSEQKSRFHSNANRMQRSELPQRTQKNGIMVPKSIRESDVQTQQVVVHSTISNEMNPKRGQMIGQDDETELTQSQGASEQDDGTTTSMLRYKDGAVNYASMKKDVQFRIDKPLKTQDLEAEPMSSDLSQGVETSTSLINGVADSVVTNDESSTSVIGGTIDANPMTGSGISGGTSILGDNVLSTPAEVSGFGNELNKGMWSKQFTQGDAFGYNSGPFGSSIIASGYSPMSHGEMIQSPDGIGVSTGSFQLQQETESFMDGGDLGSLMSVMERGGTDEINDDGSPVRGSFGQPSHYVNMPQSSDQDIVSTVKEDSMNRGSGTEFMMNSVSVEPGSTFVPMSSLSYREANSEQSEGAIPGSSGFKDNHALSSASNGKIRGGQQMKQKAAETGTDEGS